ncbi:MAG: trigger factor, partial [Patescibacteria group bacterium]|jgi:trigger factor
MQVKIEYPSKTEAVMTVIPTDAELQNIKEHVLTHFQDKVKVPGFRSGKTPVSLIEKHVEPEALQSQFLEEAIEQLYGQSIRAQKVRPVDRPEIAIKKFVPFTTLEFEAKFPVVNVIKLADYKKIKKAKVAVKLTAEDVNDVIKSLQQRISDKKDVDRAAKAGDQVWIDFKGTDAKGKPVNGADGKDYPLTLGSNAFIPGFEDNLIGLKANQDKTFTLTFPKDYGVAALAGKKVTFEVSVTKVQEVVEPKVDDDFAAKVGPFKTVAELKADIKKQVGLERQQQSDRQYESDLVREIAKKSELEIPKVLIDDQVERMEQEERQNLVYRGQTWEEHLKDEGVSEQQHKEQKRPEAEERVKISLVLAEVADNEGLQVTGEELDVRMQLLRGQYQDPAMQAELNKPQARSDIASRILTEKTLEKLVGYATK